MPPPPERLQVPRCVAFVHALIGPNICLKTSLKYFHECNLMVRYGITVRALEVNHVDYIGCTRLIDILHNQESTFFLRLMLESSGRVSSDQKIHQFVTSEKYEDD